jgi:hypothetical protein
MTVTELWLAFECGEHFRYIAIYDNANFLDQEKDVHFWYSMPSQNVTVFLFAGRGMKTARNT